MTLLLDQAREFIMTSDDAALIPVFPCLCDLDNLVWSSTNCKRVVRYIRENNNVLLEVRRADNAESGESEGSKYVLVDLEKTSVGLNTFVSLATNSKNSHCYANIPLKLFTQT